MLIFFQIFKHSCPFFLFFFVSVTLFLFLRELFKYPVSVFCLFLCIFHMDGAVKLKISSNIYMYINMNGGMKVNKVAFCMEDGRVGLLLCAAQTHGMWFRRRFDIRAPRSHSLAFRNLIPVGGTAF